MKLLFVFIISSLCFHSGCCEALVGLYGVNDNVTILMGANFNDTIFDSPYIWIVEFYSSWCGHCQEFAPIFKSFAKGIADWQAVIQLAVINCPEGTNQDLCRRMTVKGYPELRIFPPFSNRSYPGIKLSDYKRTVKNLREAAVDSAVKHLDQVKWSLEGIPKPIFRYATYQDILNFQQSEKVEPYYFAAIMEPDDSSVGKEVILDVSSCNNITTRRINSDSDELLKIGEHFRLELQNFPNVFVFTKDNLVKEIEVKIKDSGFYSYKLKQLPGVGDPKLLPKQVMIGKSQSISHVIDWKEVDRSKVYMSDIESGLRYALTVEVSAIRVLEGGALGSLKTFIGTLAMLSEELPVQKSTRNFIGKLIAWMAGKDRIRYSTWLNRMEDAERDSYIPQSDQRWVGCAPSQPGLRGYPCSLWTLFHSLSLAAYNLNERDFEAVPRAMEAYITNFFGCMACRKNFAKELIDKPYEGTLKSNEDVVLWLWKLHNKVNGRLSGAVSEDPNIKKVQFPPPELCSECRRVDGSWDEENVIKFLVNYYSADKISEEYLNTTVPEPKQHTEVDLFDSDDGEFQLQHTDNRDEIYNEELPARVEFESDFDAGGNDDTYERAGKNPRKGKFGHPDLIKELLEDRLKEHAIDILEEFGGDGYSRLHPRDLAVVGSWHGQKYKIGFTGFDTSLCILLWGSSMMGVVLLYCYMQRYRAVGKYCKV